MRFQRRIKPSTSKNDTIHTMELPIEKKLKEKDIPFRLIALSRAAISVEDVISISNGEIVLNEICKTVIVKGKKSGNLYGVLMLGMDKISFPKLKAVLGEEMTMGDFLDVKQVAGVEPGAVCPFMLTAPLLVDVNVEGIGRMNCGSGDHLFGLEFNQDDLKKAVEYTIGDFVKEDILHL